MVVASTPPVSDCPDGTVITHHSVDYGCVISPHTGKVWLDRNLGATMVCTESRDSGSFADDDAYIASQEDCFGDYYQWGRNHDGHQESDSDTTDTLATNVTTVGHGNFIKNGASPYDWAFDDTDNDGAIRIANWSKTDGTSVCPTGYRVPTEDELKDETTDASPEVKNRDDAFNSFLKLPSAGYHEYSSGSFAFQGSYGSLWSASVDGFVSGNSDFDLGDADWYSSYRAFGLSVRCLRD